MCVKSIKQPTNLQVIVVIDIIDNAVVNTIDMDLVNGPLVGILWNFGSEKIKDYDEVVSSVSGLGSYIKNPYKLDLT